MDPKRLEYLKSQQGKKTVQALRAEGFIRLDNLIEAGFKARELKAAGYQLTIEVYDHFADRGMRKTLIEAGFNEADFDAIGKSATDLKGAGLSCADLLKVGWSVSTLRLPQFYGEEAVKTALKEIAAAHHDTAQAKKAVPVPMLKSAGFSIEEMKDAGFHAADLKGQGGWDSDDEKSDVDALYGAEEVWRELEVLSKTDSAPVTPDQILKARNDYLEAVTNQLKNRDDLRLLKKQSKQLDRRIKDAKEWRDDLRQKFNAIRQLEADKAKIDELIEQRDALKKEVKDKREALVSIIDQKIDHLKKQIKFQKKHTKAIRTTINDKITSLNNAFGPISIYNHELIKRSYPLKGKTPELRRRLIREAEDKLGVPEKIKFSTLKHPVEELVKAKPGSKNSKKKKWVSAEEDQYKKKPLEYLAFLEAKKEKVEWIISDHEAEIELLENVKEVARNAKALWRPVASQAVFYTLLGLARYTTTEVGMPSLLPSKASDLSPIKWRRITGKIEFNLEIGASVGVGSSAVATASVGLNIALSGSLAVEDDRRVRARLSLKLIPNVEVKVHPGGTLSVAKATAKFGFTITSQAMAFVDEKHFAHYMMFRIANIRNFQDKLMEYGARGLDYEHDPYSDSIQKIMQDQLGGPTSNNFYTEQRYYLTKKPVVKAHMPISGKIRPTVDLGAESGVIGVSGGISAQMKTPMYFQKEILALPDTSSRRAPSEEAEEAYKGTEYWEFKATGDGNCAYYSLAFVFNYAGLGLKEGLYDVQELRNLAATWIENLYDRSQQGESPIWTFDDSLYTSVEDYVDWIRSGRLDTTGRHRQWADLPVLAALAECFLCKIHIHQEGQDVIVLPPNPRQGITDVHLAFRGNNHYNALIEKETIEPPVIAAENKPQDIQDADPRPVHFIETGDIQMDLGKAVTRLDKRRPRHSSASEILAAKKELRQKYTPRIIVLGRMGNSMSLGGNVNFESWVNIGLEGTLSRINHHINPDNDGDYLNVKTKASLLQRTFAAEPTGPPEVGDSMGREALGDVWKQSKPPANLGLDKLGNALGPVELKVDFMSRYVEWNYVKEGGFYRKQYRRYAYTSGMSIGVSGDVDVYPGFVAGLSFSFGFSKAVAMSESIGDNTLTYLQTVFNGLKLRPDGKKQWDFFLKKHSSSLRVMYRKIGKSADHSYKKVFSKKVKLKNAHKRAEELENLVKDNKHIWERDDNDPDWCPKKSDEAEACYFIQRCKSGVGELQVSRKDRIKGGLRAKYRKTPGCMDELNDRLTTLLWRSGQVLSVYNERMNPFKRKVRYLIPAKGSITFNTRLGDNGMQLMEAPIITVPRKESKAEWVRYKSAADIWLNPSLRRAEDALAFYRAGFLIELNLKLPHGKTKTLKIHPMGSVAADKDKDNNELIQQFFMEVALEAVKKRKGNLDDFEALVKIDADLARFFKSWIIHLGADTFRYRKIIWNKKVKAKYSYPHQANGMELLPLDRDLLVLDKDGFPKKLPPSEAKDNRQSLKINLANAPDCQAQYGGHQEENQKALSVEEKWICKANLLWEEWVSFKEKQLKKESGGAVNNVEIILSKIKGPFPGYSDDNDFFLTNLESL